MTNRTKAVLGLSGVFLLGAICGALLLGVFVRREMRDARRMHDPEGFREFFADRLKLTESQRDSLQGELQRAYDDLAALRYASAEEYRELLDSLKHRIAPLLTPEQRELLDRQEDRFRRHFPRIPRPGKAFNVNEPMIPSDSLARTPGGKVPPPGPNQNDPKPPPAPKAAPKPTDHLPSDTGRGQNTVGSAGESVDPDAGNLLPTVEKLRARLSLSDAQARRIDAIVRQTRKTIRTDVADLRGFERLQAEAVGRGLREMDREIEAVLEPSQLPAYEEVRREIRRKLIQRFGGKGRRGGGGRRQ